MNNKRNQKRGAKRVIPKVLGILLLLIILAATCVLIYVNHMLSKIPKVDPVTEQTISPSEADAFLYEDPELVPIDPSTTETYMELEDITFPSSIPDPTEPATPTETTGKPVPTQPATQPPIPDTSLEDIYGNHVVNILLVGQDRREGQSRQRSDTMILVSLNKSNSTITLTSFMRDQYVRIPGYNPNKLNAAYAFGGMRLLSETLKLNFGVQVDGVVEVDFSGFENIIDLLGGVDVTLTQAEADYFNRKNYGVVVGVNHFNGRMALSYARVRSIDSDYARANRQRKLVAGLIESYKNLPLDEMLNMLDEILPLVTTNLSNTQILSYAAEFFLMLANAKIQTLRIPVEGTFTHGLVQVRENFCGWFQYNIDFEANKKVLWDVFRRQN